MARPATDNETSSIYDEWFNGDEWVFDQGVDYEGPSRLFIKQLRYRAELRGLKIMVTGNENTWFSIRAYDPDEDS